MNEKQSLEVAIENKKKVLNFGCGADTYKCCDNVDISMFRGVNKTFDFNIFPYPLEDDTYDFIFCDNIFEHIDNLSKVIGELWRVSKHLGVIHINVPYYNYSGAFNDPEHRHWFNQNTLNILFQGRRFRVMYQKFEARKGFKWISMKILLPISAFIPNLIYRIEIEVKVKK